MADETTTTQTTPTQVTPPAPVHAAPAAPQEKTTFSLEYVQELRAENAKYRTTAKEKADAAEAEAAKALEAQKQADAKVQEATTKANERIIRAELKAEAIKAGMVDLDGLKLADLSSVKLDEKGEVIGAADLMKSLKESKPYLFGAVSSTTQIEVKPPKKEDPKPFDARTATDAERAAEAKKLGIKPKQK